MERKIGEIFNYQDNLYQRIKSITCTNCGFNNKGCLADKHITGDCSGRLDGASVIFRKLEKVGNPIMVENKSYQKIKVPDSLCNNCAFYDNFSRNCKLSYYTENGVFSNGGTGKNRDLMILLEKKEGWVNIYGEEKERYCSNVIYSSKEEALNISKQLKEHITTIKIEWKE